MSSKVYIIILNYNNYEDTIECLESLFYLNYDDFNIVLVDNKSTNDSVEKIEMWANGEVKLNKKGLVINESTQPLFAEKISLVEPDGIIHDKYKITFIKSDINGGFAAGNNLAINYIQSLNNYNYIWLLNNDTVVVKDSLTQLLNTAESNDYGITGSTLLEYYGDNKVQALGGSVNKYFGTCSNVLDKNKLSSIDYIVGASFLISRNTVESIGVMVEDYFLYYEEVDYCYAAKKKGVKLGVSLDSIIYHKEGSSTGGSSSSSSKKSSFSDLLSVKNRITFYKKYFGVKPLFVVGILITVFIRLYRLQFKRAIKILFMMKNIFYVSHHNNNE